MNSGSTGPLGCWDRVTIGRSANGAFWMLRLAAWGGLQLACTCRRAILWWFYDAMNRVCFEAVSCCMELLVLQQMQYTTGLIPDQNCYAFLIDLQVILFGTCGVKKGIFFYCGCTKIENIAYIFALPRQ